MISLKRLKLLAVLMLVMGTVWLAVGEIRERGALASKQLAMAAKAAMERGEHDLAMLLALEGVPAGKGQVLPIDSLQARFALGDAVRKNRLTGIYPKDYEDVSGAPEINWMPKRSDRRMSADGALKVEIEKTGIRNTSVWITHSDDIETRTDIGAFDREIVVLTFVPSDKFIVIGLERGAGDLGDVYSYNIDTGVLSKILKYGRLLGLKAFDFDITGQFLYVAVQYPPEILVWDLENNEYFDHIRNLKNRVTSLQASPLGCDFLTSTYEGDVHLWRGCSTEGDEEHVPDLRKPLQEGVKFSQFSEDGSLYRTVTNNGNIKHWVSAEEQRQPQLLVGRESWSSDSDFAQINLDLGLATRFVANGMLEVLRLPSMDVVRRINLTRTDDDDPDYVPSGFARFNTSGDRLVTLSDGRLAMWGLSGPPGDLGVDLQAEFYSGDLSNVSGIEASFLARNRVLLLADSSSIGIWDAEKTEKSFEWIWQRKDRDGEILDNHKRGLILIKYFGEYEEDDVVKILDLTDDSTIELDLSSHLNMEDQMDLRFSPDGGRIFAEFEDESGEQQVAFYDALDGSFEGLVVSLGEGEFLDDDSDQYISWDNELGLLSAYDLKLNRTRSTDISSIEIYGPLGWIEEGDAIALHGIDDAIYIVEMPSGQVEFVLSGQKDPQAVSEIGNGLLVSTSYGDGAWIWNLRDSSLVHILDGHANYKGGVMFLDFDYGDGLSVWEAVDIQNAKWKVQISPDRKFFVAQPSARGIELWANPLEDGQIASACASLPENRRRLTDEEFARHGIKARSQGPCDRHGPLSPEFWREKAEGVGLLH